MSEILETVRVEKKYSLSAMELAYLYQKLNKVLQEDVHNRGSGGYIVRSLYFDTLNDRDYTEKEDGIEVRRKIRLRTYYADADRVKLELKAKQGEFQKKQSLSVSREDAILLMKGEYSVLCDYESPLAWELFSEMSTKCYRPKCIVEYKRQAFYVEENDIRITLDTNIRASESNLDLFAKTPSYYPVDIFDKGILEVKYNRFLLSYIKDTLSLSNRIQTSYSKYAMARRISKGI